MSNAGSAIRSLLRSSFVIAAGFSPSLCSASLVGAGDIAFIRFNADGMDDFAIVLLADADAGQQVHFNDNLYNSQFNVFASNEDRFTWNITDALSAGTVVSFSNLNNGGSPGVVSHGTISGDPVNTMQLSESGETIYAFLGSSNSSPSTFLSAVTTESSAVLNGTGLLAGDTAVVLPTDIDEAHYIGNRDTETAFADYRPLIGNVSGNWTVRTTDTGSLGAFDTTNFTLAGTNVPESPRVVLLCLCGILCCIVGCGRKPRQAAV